MLYSTKFQILNCELIHNISKGILSPKSMEHGIEGWNEEGNGLLMVQADITL